MSIIYFADGGKENNRNHPHWTLPCMINGVADGPFTCLVFLEKWDSLATKNILDRFGIFQFQKNWNSINKVKLRLILLIFCICQCFKATKTYPAVSQSIQACFLNMELKRRANRSKIVQCSAFLTVFRRLKTTGERRTLSLSSVSNAAIRRLATEWLMAVGRFATRSEALTQKERTH